MSLDPLTDLSAALDQFDRAAANLEKAERMWNELESAIPTGILFGLDTPQLNDLRRSYIKIIEALPAIDGFRPSSEPLTLDEIAQARFDAAELAEPEALVALEQTITLPERELAEYRFKLDRARRQVTRSHVLKTIEHIDRILRDVSTSEGLGTWNGAPRWDELRDVVSELERLVGTNVPRLARWSDLRRHLRFAEANDLHDIVVMDWPSVRAEVQTSLYSDNEPIPVAVDDLGALVRAHPTGPVRAKVDWSRLSASDFEGLLFELLRHTPGYENVNWLMRTNAADRGRDIEAYRVLKDPLTGVERHRAIIQCKHWPNRSVGGSDLIHCLETVTLWEPPLIDLVVIATTGRFSQDAVALAEKRNHERSRPAVILWPDSHLETLLADRPAIATHFGLR